MTIPMRSTIAQLLYPNEQALDFARIVAELETVLSRLRGTGLEIEWDCDDVVTFDTAETRILLARAEYGRAGKEACLTVAAGPLRPHAGLQDEPVNYEALCSRLVERIQSRARPIGIIWREVCGLVDADVADELVDLLPTTPAAPLPPVESILDHVMRTDLFKTASITPQAPANARFAPAGDIRARMGRGLTAMRPSLRPEEVQDSLRQIFRAAARPAVPQPEPQPQPKAEAERPSTPMRLTAHCFNAALILVYAPLGASVMTYSLLKGEDIKLSARLMSVAGTLVALSQTPIGSSVKAMAGTMVKLAQSPLTHGVQTIIGA